ncbi:hypothetical protein ETA_14460 [Erwinia tasmaniensis Et1/99]|uniref:Uncharacterized protein n=1 Tax=Erwinia tasmaniensis (strain DSM 17950 / CFBP 7177 / CIP 109463 / NCPPB 4357 / Et1/99) TaxID=465817 RepID=B2VJJ2_ERWT9|nr:hypothetical protein ETA_14460 [Erwinia tasmaniensis Et1/99]
MLEPYDCGKTLRAVVWLINDRLINGPYFLTIRRRQRRSEAVIDSLFSLHSTLLLTYGSRLETGARLLALNRHIFSGALRQPDVISKYEFSDRLILMFTHDQVIFKIILM